MKNFIKNTAIYIILISFVYVCAYFNYNGFPEFDRTIWYIDFTIYLFQFVAILIIGIALLIFLLYLFL